MKKLIEFNTSFTPFSFTDFISCYSSIYAFLENRKDEAEQIFFLFDTMCGRRSIRQQNDQQPTKKQNLIGETQADVYYNGTDSTIDFLFGFAGYGYFCFSVSIVLTAIASISNNRLSRYAFAMTLIDGKSAIFNSLITIFFSS